ncbi:MAG: hypothetical protein KDA52_05325 [Planctomycetaceae bacterium]|nr:hypothetical protein [Planctomycetaceae bacterium]
MSLAILSAILLFFWAGAGYVEPFAMAEALSEQLAPRLEIDKHDLERHLQSVLKETAMRRTVGRCAALALLTLLLWLRVLVDTGWFTRSPEDHRTME